MSKLFTHVQFLGFNINTTPNTTYNPLGVADGVGREFVEMRSTYLGIANATTDLTERCKVMEAAIKKAWTVSHKLPTTLKLFMAPEFFFRGTKGGYDDMLYVHQIREKLIAMVSDNKYSAWLFVFGSVIASSEKVDVVRDPVTKGWIANPRTAGSKDECYNIVFVHPGAAGSEATRVVMKELKSGIDFVRSQDHIHGSDKFMMLPRDTAGKLAHETTEHLRPARPSGANRERSQSSYSRDTGGGIFDFEKLTLGLEICLDHHKDVTRLKRSRPAHGAWEIQLQIVPSAGMSINPESVICSRGGYVFNVDGVRAASAVSKVKTTSIGSTPATLDNVAETKKVLVPKGPRFTQLFVDCTPEIAVFPKVQIPGRKKST